MKRRKEKQWNQRERAKRERVSLSIWFLTNFLMVFVIGGFQRNTNIFQGGKYALPLSKY